MKKRILSILLICCMVFSLFPVSALAANSKMPFTDVKTTDWFYDEACYVYDEGLMQGTSATTFNPNGTTNRGMIVTILYRLEGEPTLMNDNIFTDVEPGSWYEKAVVWANGKGIVEGYGNGKFGPSDPITREQLAAIMYRYASYKGYDVSEAADLSGFVDSGKISSYAMNAMKWANAAGLITGIGASKLDPHGYATRAQVAAIFYRFCGAFVTKDTCKVTFDLNYENAGTYTTQNVKTGEKAARPTAPTRSGYTFAGWYTKDVGGTKFDFGTAVTSDLTLYAHWTKNGGNTPYAKWTAKNTAIEEAVADGTEIKADGEKVTVTSGDDKTSQSLTAEQATELAGKINDLLESSAVADFSDNGLKESTQIETDGKDAIIAALKDAASDDTAKGNLDGKTSADIDLKIKVVLSAVNVKATDDLTVTSMEFDVTPIATTTVKDSSGKTVSVTADVSDCLTTKVTFRLPIDSSLKVTGNTIAVYHEGEFLGNYEIKGTGTDTYIEIESADFSKYGYQLLNENNAGAKIGTTLYFKFADAVASVANDQTITLLKPATGSVAVGREVTFTVDKNGKNFNATVSAGTGYALYKDETQSSITYKCLPVNTEFTITYKDQGDAAFSGTHGASHPTTHTFGTATTLVAPTKSGYAFKGWFTNKECTGTAVTSLGATEYAEDITLYAKWTEAKTFAEILATVSDGFPTTDANAWTNGNGSGCRKNSASLYFFKEGITPSTISDSLLAEKVGDNYVFALPVFTVTFVMSGDKLTQIIFNGTGDVSVLNGTYAAPVEYMDWDETNNELVKKYVGGCIEVTNATTTLAAGKFYVVKGADVQTGTLTVNGTASEPTTLILMDGAKLTATGTDYNAGINVTSDKALVITGQSGGTGTLIATGDQYGAGIGGGDLSNGGNVTINGGSVTAYGGTRGAGIGGGDESDGGTVTINGGSVTATGKDGGAAIGKGKDGSISGTVTFGEGVDFIINAGADAGSASSMSASEYADNHDAAYVSIEEPAAPTFKALYNTAGGANTLTFYYDAVDHSGEGITVYEGSTGDNYLFDNLKSNGAKWGYNGIRSSVKSVEIDSSVADYKGLTSTAFMFQGMTTATNISGAEHLDVSNVTDMSYMFNNFGGGSNGNPTTLNSVPDVSGWNTGNVTNMTAMFESYGNFSSSLDKVPDVSGWNTEKVTNMSFMFQKYGHESQTFNAVPDVSNWDTGNVTNMNNMFFEYGHKSTALNTVPDVSGWNTGKVDNMRDMFNSYGYTSTALNAVPNVSKWNTGKVENMQQMFYEYGFTSTNISCVLDLSGWDLSKITGTNGVNVFNFNPKTFNVTIPAKTGEKSNEGDKWYYGGGTNFIAPPAGKTFTLPAPEIKYMDWDDTKKELVEKSTSNYTEVTNSTITLEGGKFYVVKGADVQTGTIIVNGTADKPTTLILMDGAKLTATGENRKAGIEVASDNALVITGQKNGTGTLIANGNSGAGIGGGYRVSSGTVTINGGTVTATGDGGAGIGGGVQGSSDTVTINGGTVVATAAGYNGAAGIGGGIQGSSDTVTINGGTVTATGHLGGAGIGGGTGTGRAGDMSGSSNTVTINGGTVTATGVDGGAGIGGGANGGASDTVTINGGTVSATATGTKGGAGIGSGNRGSSKTVTINGGTVTANGGAAGGAGIGSGYGGNGASVTINGGTVNATGGNSAAGIGGGQGYYEGDIVIGGAGGTVTINGGTVTAKGYEAIGKGECSTDSGTVAFGAVVSFTINAGADKDNTESKTTTAYASDHTAAYVSIEEAVKPETLEYVEIGGVKWATKNLGAEKETDYGDYFAWGETAPYYEGTGGWPETPTWKSGKDSGYAWQSYCGNSTFSEWSTPPYDATTKILKPDFDAAAQILGDGWRMPTSAEFKALYDACLNGSYNTTTDPSGASASVGKGVYWCTSYDGVAGCLFCDGTNKLFFPAAGYGGSNGLSNAGSNGYYWSSTLYPDDTSDGWRMYFYNTGVLPQHYTYRYWGHSVRPVKAAAPAAVTYMDWDETNKKLVEKSTTEAIEVTNTTTALEAGKFYVVKGTVSTGTLTVNGTTASPTTLILADGAKLTATGTDYNAGINVTSDKALVITGQSGGTGVLIANGGNGGAGIGGGSWGNGANVTINGGTVTATGGEHGAGIGGGISGPGGTVAINGGTVTATSDDSAVAIGAGYDGASSGTLTFGAGVSFTVMAGASAPGSATTAAAYAFNHSAAYVHIEGLADGYYLVGNFNDVYHWSVDTLTADMKLTEDKSVSGQYKLDWTFYNGDEIKIVEVANGVIATWYNEGGSNYEITEAGEGTVYFRPEGNMDWSYFYLTVNPKVVTVADIADGVIVNWVRDMNNAYYLSYYNGNLIIVNESGSTVALSSIPGTTPVTETTVDFYGPTSAWTCTVDGATYEFMFDDSFNEGAVFKVRIKGHSTDGYNGEYAGLVG